MKVYFIKDYCTPDWPLSVTREMRLIPQEEEHYHDCYEIMIALSDGGSCAVGGVSYPVHAGSIFLCKPEDSHSFIMPVGNSIGNIMFKPEILCKAGQKLLKLIPSGVFRIFTENNFDQLLAMLAGMERELTEKTEGYRCYTGAVMQFFLTSIYRRINDMPDMAGISGNDEMEIILDYIREHYQEKISLQLLGELIGRSAVYTGKLFHQVTRCCFSKYLLRYRLGKAQELLRNSRLTITEIAYHTGFFDSSHFTRSFEKNCGMLPLAYRRKYRRQFVP